MGEKKPNPVTINDKEYEYSDLTPEQQALFSHCVDLDRKIDSARFNLDQLAVGKQAFVNILKDKLNAPVEKTEVEVVQ